MNREIALIIAAIITLIIIIYTIRKISKLQVSKSYKLLLYYLTIIIPILGLFLTLRAERKS